MWAKLIIKTSENCSKYFFSASFYIFFSSSWQTGFSLLIGNTPPRRPKSSNHMSQFHSIPNVPVSVEMKQIISEVQDNTEKPRYGE